MDDNGTGKRNIVVVETKMELFVPKINH